MVAGHKEQGNKGFHDELSLRRLSSSPFPVMPHKFSLCSFNNTSLTPQRRSVQSDCSDIPTLRTAAVKTLLLLNEQFL